jgi:hypothetical protein
MMQLFLAYARENGDQVAVLEDCLRTNGYRVIRDVPAATSNPFWREALHPFLTGATAIVVAWSREAACSPWIDQEMRAAGGPRVWLTIDDESLPEIASGERWTASPREIVEMLREVVPRREHAPAMTTSPIATGVVDSRRRDHLQRDAAFARAWVSGAHHKTILVELREGFLFDSRNGMLFRHVQDDAYLGVLSITIEQYARFAGAVKIPMPLACRTLAPDVPVVGVTWFEAMACSAWFGGTLPSEALWQHAASAAGALSYATVSGDLSGATAYYGAPFARGTPAPQTSYAPTPSGFFGMCGNTWDWCSDTWGSHRIVRGGGSMDSERFCRVTARYRNAPIDRDCAVGFRVQIQVHQRKDGRYETGRHAIPQIDC